MIGALLCSAIVVTEARAAQAEKPDFSGVWELVVPAEAAPVPSTLIVHQTVHGTSVRGTPLAEPLIDLTVEGEFMGAFRSDTYRIDTVGGKVGGVVGGRSPTPISNHQSRWREGTLVISTVEYTSIDDEAKVAKERQEEWTLDAQQRLVITVTETRPGSARTVTTLTYRKRRSA